jgi:hypothetical protein
VTPPPTGGVHAYFDSLVARSDHYKSYSLRDPKQLAIRNNGGYAQNNSRPPAINYIYPNDPDPRKQDAAKMIVSSSPSLSNQLYLPFGAGSGHTYFVTFDLWWGQEWDYTNTGIATYKTIQIANPSGSTSPCPADSRWFELQHRFSTAPGTDIARVTARSYWPAADPIPQVGIFTVKPERWTRYWILIDRTAASSFVSLWAADTQTDAVQLINRFQKTPCASLDNIWTEFNTSSTLVAPVTRVVYLKNFVILRDVANVAPLLVRP